MLCEGVLWIASWSWSVLNFVHQLPRKCLWNSHFPLISTLILCHRHLTNDFDAHKIHMHDAYIHHKSEMQQYRTIISTQLNRKPWIEEWKEKIILLKIQIGFLLLHLHRHLLLPRLCLLIPFSCYNILEKMWKEMRQERAGAYYFCSKYVKISIKWHSILNSLILIIPVHLRCISFDGSVSSVSSVASAKHIWSFHFLGRVARACSRSGCWLNKRVTIEVWCMSGEFAC